MAKNIKENDDTQDTDSLFAPDQDIFHNACLKRADMSWYLYADGYRRAANILSKSCHTFYDRNTLAYPMIFLYRQYIELALKELIREANKVVKKKNQLPMIHKLDQLWSICKKIIKERGLPISEKDIKAVKNYIDQFSQVDPTSMAFRYPESNLGFSLVL
jgi:hypothetical protein